MGKQSRIGTGGGDASGFGSSFFVRQNANRGLFSVSFSVELELELELELP
jgi:hypothetical protein